MHSADDDPLQLIAHLNQALTPIPGPSLPRAECHHPSGKKTDSPGATSTRHAPSSLNAAVSWSLALFTILGGSSCSASREKMAGTDKGI